MSVAILTGCCLSLLATLPAESAQTCVTSPPYWNLRDYGQPDQLGQETSSDEYVGKLVSVFRGVKRVLKNDGTLWLNLGDTYLPGKQLAGIPWRVALALQADGWYLRSEVIWSKPNPMPESATDRPTRSHETIFLLAKSERYFYDHESVKEPCSEANVQDFKRRKTLNNKGKGAGTYEEARPDLCRSRDAYMPDDFRRNRRSVWAVGAKPFADAHFATYPPELIEPCILAGCPKGGTVLDPFFGAGTTGLVADRLGRHCIGIELNRDYVQIAQRRLRTDAGLFAEIVVVA